MATHRHKKMDQSKKEEMNPSSEKEDRNHQQALANEGPGHKLRYSLPVRKKAICNKARGIANLNNKSNSGSLFDLAAHMVSWTGQTCKNCISVEKADPGESSGEIKEACASVQGGNLNGASTLKKRLDISKMPNWVNVSCPNTHTSPAMMHVKAKPNFSLKRDLVILPNRTADEENLHTVIDNTGDVFKKSSDSASLDRRSNRLMKSRKEDVQDCKKSFGGFNVPLTKVRSVKDVSSREPAQSKLHNMSRSLSPALIIKQHGQQAVSKERRAKDYNSLKADADTLRQNQHQQRKCSSGSKPTVVSVRASKLKLEYRQMEDRDNKIAAHKTEIGVTRLEGPVISAASSHNGSLLKMGKARKSSPLPLPVSVASSMSDTYICGPKQQRPQSTGRTRQHATARFKIENRGLSTAECPKKTNVADKGDAHNKRETKDNVSGLPRSSFSGRDLKSETPPSAPSGKQDVHQRIRNPKLSGSAGSQQQISNGRRHVRSLKWNSSVKASSGIMSINTPTILVNRGNAFPKASVEENKQVKISTVKLSTKGYTYEPLVSPQNTLETGKGKRAALANTKQRVDARENKISDCNLTDCLLNAYKKTHSDPINSETHAYEIVDQAGPSTNLVSLDTLVQAVSSAQLFCPLSRNDKMNISPVEGIQSDVTHADILPAIYFCWQKCTDQQTEEGAPQQEAQHVVSLDQGLSVLRQIMMDAISENTLYSQEYTLKQLINKEAKYSSNYGVISNNDKGILLAGNCFQLTPRFKGTKSNQIAWSAESTGGSTLIGSFYGDDARFLQESRQTMLCLDQGDRGPRDAASCETLCGTNDTLTAINISKAIRNSIQRRMNMASLWSSVTKGIIAFFLHALEKPSISYSDLDADTIDDNGTTVDALVTFLDKGHSSHVAPQKTASPGQVTLEQIESPCSNLVTGKRHSPEKGTCNNDTSSKDEHDSAKSKLDPCENTIESLQEALNTRFGESEVDCSHACGKSEFSNVAIEMEIPESHPFREQIQVVTNTHTAASHVVELRFANYRKDTTISENFRKSKPHKEYSHCNYSNTRIAKSTHSEKAEVNEVNNIPFSTNVYESLEGPNRKHDCNSVFEMQHDFLLRTYQNDEVEFVAPHENCPDPDMCYLENDDDVDVAARPSCYDTSSFRNYPHLMWTWKYGRSMMDSEEQPVFDSRSCTANERAELYDGSWQLHKTDQSKYNGCQDASVHVTSSKGYFQKQGASVHDTSVDGFNCYTCTDGPCQDVCHTIVSQKHGPPADDNLLEGNAEASSQHMTSSHIVHDVKGQDGSGVNGKDACGIIYKQPLSCTKIKVSYSPSEANDEIKRRRYLGTMNPHKCVRSSNLMEHTSPYNINVQINHAHPFDEGGFFYDDYSESACKHNDYTTSIDGDTDCFRAFLPNADDFAGEANRDDAFYKMNSPKTQTTVDSRTTAERAVNEPTECSKSADISTTISNADCTQSSNQAALLFNDQHGCFTDSLATRDTNSPTLETMIATIVSPRQQSGHNISTDDNETIVSQGSVSCLAPRKQSRQFLSIDSITRAANALKQASTSHMSYLCNSHTATACSFLISVGCSNPFAVTLSNLFTQQLSRDSQGGMLDHFSSSVDDRALDWKPEDAVDYPTFDEDRHNLIPNDSLECGGVNSDLPKSFLCTKKCEHEFACTSSDSSQLVGVRQRQQETTRKISSLTKRACTLPRTISVNHVNRISKKTATAERSSSLDPSVAPRTARPSTKRNNNFSNSSQQVGHKTLTSEACVSRTTDLLLPNTCQSGEGQESSIFSNFSLASPPASRATRLNEGNSSSGNFESIFKRNSVYLKELPSQKGSGSGLPQAD